MRTARCLLVLGPALASVNYPQQNYGWGPPPPGGEPQQPVARAAPPGHPQQQGAAPGQPPPAMPEGALVPSGVPWHVLEMRRPQLEEELRAHGVEETGGLVSKAAMVGALLKAIGAIESD